MKTVKTLPQVPTERPTFVTEYVHYRTGKKMRAVDYGYKAWPFGPTSKAIKRK